MDNVVSEIDPICPVNLSELTEMLKGLMEMLSMGKLDVHERSPVESDNIKQRAINFHENLEVNSGKTQEVVKLNNSIEDYKQKIKSLEEARELNTVKIELLESQQNSQRKTASSQERDLMDRLESLEGKYKRDLTEKEKALDMLQAEVES